MKKFLTIVGALMALGAAYVVPAEAQINWVGPYVGANLGGALDLNNGQHTCYASGVPNTPGCRNVPYNGMTGSGVLGGLQAGYNFQFGGLYMYGAEADFQGANITGKNDQTGVYPFFSGAPGLTSSTFINKQTIDWFGTLRGRLGYTGFDRFLVYGTAGLIYGHENLGTTLSVQSFGTFSAYKSTVNIGWIAGVGAEYALTSHLGIKGEALYYDAGTTTVTTNGVGVFTHTTDFQMRGPIFRVGLNYQFGVPTPPPPMAPTPVAAPAPAPRPAPAARMFIVFFDFDKATLTPDGQKVVDAAAAAFKAGGNPQLQVSGYTDLSGTAAYNLKLSQRRADAVDAALVKDGVPKNAIASHAMGKNNPRVPTADGVREPQNRRVEIVFPG